MPSTSPFVPPTRSDSIELPPTIDTSSTSTASDTALPQITAILQHEQLGVDVENHTRDPLPLALPPVSTFTMNSNDPVRNQDVAEPNADVPAHREREADHENRDHGEDEDRSNADDENDEENDHSSASDGEVMVPPADPYPWTAIDEDKSTPCNDELKYITDKGEYSALDYTYWEQKAFFELDDPDLRACGKGRIDWTIENFNGTQEKPVRQLVMKSPIVKIGDYEWQIKLYPKGNGTDFLSVYVDCISMQRPDFVASCDFVDLPLPMLKGRPMVKRRISVAAQVAVVMYNPAEPRTHEFKADAFQYHHQCSDHGWTYFSQMPRPSFYHRRQGQRQAILRDDRLAFLAYIQVVNDPTGCMWGARMTDTTDISSTGLRAMDATSAQVATLIMLVHLRPIRLWLLHTKHKSPTILMLQALLRAALERKLKKKHLKMSTFPIGCDVVAVMDALHAKLAREGVATEFKKIFGSPADDDLPTGHNRLRTRYSYGLKHATSNIKPSATPPVLIIELERQMFDTSKRSWEKIKNGVELDDHIVYGNQQYTLCSFVTHSGSFASEHFVPFVRPGGPGKLWYAYEADEVKCLTHKAAAAKYSKGENAVSRSRFDLVTTSRRAQAVKRQDAGIAYLATYIRADTVSIAFTLPKEETFATPDSRTWISPGVKKRPLHHESSKAHQVSVKETALAAVQQNVPVTNMTGVVSDDSALSMGMMDGDDIIMSDAEDDREPEALLVQTMHTPGNTATCLAYDRRQSEMTTKKTFSYFCGESYAGDVMFDNLYHGHGWLIRTNGDEYKGSLSNGQLSGHGTMIYSKSGDRYTGQWFEGQHHGVGTLVEKETGNVYEGGWKAGRRHGAFVLRGTVTEDDKHYCQICYEKEISTAFYDCGHALACKQCAMAVQSCPVCRKPVMARLELFGVKISMQ